MPIDRFRWPSNGVAMCGYLLMFCGILNGTAAIAQPCRIQILDRENDWPVPLVELQTNHGVRFVSDNAGNIAFDLPELMGEKTWFHVRGHGYGLPADGFGFRGLQLTPQPGETLTVHVDRQLPGKRLGRLTGAGIFAESQKLGLELDWQDQKILGCDSVQNVIHNGRTFWGWGDTTLAHYPLGNFHMIGATTAIQPLENLQPPVRLRFEYFTNPEAVPRNVAKLSGEGPTWLFGYVSLKDANGKQHLGSTYSKIKPPLEAYETGLCVWDEANKRFEREQVVWSKQDDSPTPPPMPTGHAIPWTDPAGEKWMLFGDPFPTLKCKATFESWKDPAQWQTLKPQAFVQTQNGDRAVKPHRGAVAWSEYRKKWVTVFTQLAGESSYLGELWYAEADAPTGPWRGAIQVVTHDEYSFYNPQLHLEFVASESPVLLFEATYTKEFSKTKVPTPRFNYNQILYRLDLDTIDFD